MVFFYVSLKGWPALAIRTLAMRQLPFGDSCHSNTLAIWTLAIRDTCHSDTSCSNLAKLSEENKNHFLNWYTDKMTEILLGIAEYWLSYVFSVKIQIMYRMASVRRATVPNGNCLEWQVSRMASVSNGNCTEWQLSQMATVCMASVSNGKCPKGKWRPAKYFTHTMLLC